MADADLPPRAVADALHALHETGCGCGKGHHPPSPGDMSRLKIALEAAAPVIRAQAIRDATKEQYAAAIRAATEEAAGPMVREMAARIMDERLAVTEALVRVAERDRLRPLVAQWRKSAAAVASSSPQWSSHFYDCANDLERLIGGE